MIFCRHPRRLDQFRCCYSLHLVTGIAFVRHNDIIAVIEKVYTEWREASKEE